MKNPVLIYAMTTFQEPGNSPDLGYNAEMCKIFLPMQKGVLTALVDVGCSLHCCRRNQVLTSIKVSSKQLA